MTALRRLCSSAAGLFGLIVVVLILVTALVSLFWTPFDPRATDVTSRWLPPGWPHLLGTDLTGRDIAGTSGELGLAGHWIKLLLHYLFIYKAKARPLWWLIPE